MITSQQFWKIVEHFFDSAQETLSRKNGEYAKGGDPLANFRETAEFLGTGMLEALAPHLHKHYRSLMSGLLTSPIEEAEEHCIDIANYLAFIIAIKHELAKHKETT